MTNFFADLGLWGGETTTALWKVLNARLFDVAGTPVSVATLLTGVLIMVVTVVGSRLAQRAIRRTLRMRGVEDEGTIGAVSRLLHYLVLTVGFGIAIQTVGIDLSALFAAGAIFAVGLGFAMQSIAQNFVSGVILLAERSIKPGDILAVQDEVVRVLEMGIRATIVQTRDGEDLIVPNSVLIQSAVKNYTLKESAYRVRVGVGVTYGSNLALVRETLEAVARRIDDEWAVETRQPQVLMTGFGDNSVNFEVAIWMTNPWESRRAQSELHEAIWWAFQEKQIVIAFPQLDVHFDPPVHESFSSLGAGKGGPLEGSARPS